MHRFLLCLFCSVLLRSPVLGAEQFLFDQLSMSLNSGDILHAADTLLMSAYADSSRRSVCSVSGDASNILTKRINGKITQSIHSSSSGFHIRAFGKYAVMDASIRSRSLSYAIDKNELPVSIAGDASRSSVHCALAANGKRLGGSMALSLSPDAQSPGIAAAASAQMKFNSCLLHLGLGYGPIFRGETRIRSTGTEAQRHAPIDIDALRMDGQFTYTGKLINGELGGGYSLFSTDTAGTGRALSFAGGGKSPYVHGRLTLSAPATHPEIRMAYTRINGQAKGRYGGPSFAEFDSLTLSRLSLSAGILTPHRHALTIFHDRIDAASPRGSLDAFPFSSWTLIQQEYRKYNDLSVSVRETGLRGAGAKKIFEHHRLEGSFAVSRLDLDARFKWRQRKMIILIPVYGQYHEAVIIDERRFLMLRPGFGYGCSIGKFACNCTFAQSIPIELKKPGIQKSETATGSGDRVRQSGGTTVSASLSFLL